MTMNATVLTPPGKQERMAVNESHAQISPRPQVVEYVGTKVILDHEHMEVGELYPFRFGGRQAVAVKRASGAVDIFRIP